MREPAIAESARRLAEGGEEAPREGDLLGVSVLLREPRLRPLRLCIETSRFILGREKPDDRLEEKPRLMPGDREMPGLLD